ncbi:hypothetical protein C1I99_06895 [Micromonospora deserti]|uniref:Uncharacterized protein n=1 Tax=Micromonospora deserti TaxID=2070366 RepID=A0A2W2CPX6_9ACTN|nr:hypothetical protein C1I99_06895 [Micromonospora deserti]
MMALWAGLLSDGGASPAGSENVVMRGQCELTMFGLVALVATYLALRPRHLRCANRVCLVWPPVQG